MVGGPGCVGVVSHNISKFGIYNDILADVLEGCANVLLPVARGGESVIQELEATCGQGQAPENDPRPPER